MITMILSVLIGVVLAILFLAYPRLVGLVAIAALAWGCYA